MGGGATSTAVQLVQRESQEQPAEKKRSEACETIAFVCHGFPPEFHSGVFRNAAFAKYLPLYGFSPAVLTGEDRRSGPLVYGRFNTNDSEGLQIFRCVWFGPKRLAFRILDRLPVLSSLSRYLNRREVAEHVADAFLEQMVSMQPALVYGSAPPVEALYVARELARRLGIPYVADLRDPWSYCYSNVYRSALDHALDRSEERFLLNRASGVVTNTVGQKEILVSKVGIETSRVEVIPNGTDIPVDDNRLTRRPFFQEGVFNIVHVGVTSPAKRVLDKAFSFKSSPTYQAVRFDETTRSLRYVRDALLSLFTRAPEMRGLIRLHVIGEEYSEKFAYLDAIRECTIYHGGVSPSDAAAALTQGDLLLLTQIECSIPGVKGNPIVPGKLFDYLQSRSMILAALQKGDASELAGRFPGTVVVGPRNTVAIAKCIEEHFGFWRTNGKTAKYDRYLGAYKRSHVTGDLAALFRKILENQMVDRCKNGILRR